jgi:thiamine biosynthesis lipoprotein
MPEVVVRVELPAMATRFQLVLAGDDPVRLRAIGEEALAAIAECDAAISPFRAGSAIARANAAAHERPVAVDPMTFELLVACRELHAATGGRFDPTVGPLLAALGFRSAPPQGPAGIAAARARVGMHLVELDAAASTVRFLRPGMALDLGAIGKGHALDLAAEVLRSFGVARALLHGGGSTVLALGAPPGLPGWKIGIGPWEPQPTATLRDLSLSVSAGHGQQQRLPDGSAAAHVVDPTTGAPVAAAGSLAAVVAPSARTTDAWSTALLVDPRLPAPPGGANLTASGPADGVRWHATGDGAACFHLPSPILSATPP